MFLKYYHMFLNSGDPRVQDWPLVRSPLPTLAICLTYAYCVKVLGPKLMKDRKPFDLRTPMIIYNFLMVLLSSFIFLYAGILGWFNTYSWKCQPVDYSENGLPAAIGAYIYFLSKFVELTDTVFMVLRKKFDHVSTLHVVHHGIMPMSVWWGMKFVPGGHATFFGFLNSMVHIPMYLYYFLAAFGPQMNKYLFWKQYMTAFQMAQFIGIFAHSFQLIFRECDFPKAFVVWIGMHAVLFWFLFSDFYKNTYKKKADAKKLMANGNGNAITNGSVKTNGHSNNNCKDKIIEEENELNNNLSKKKDM